VSRSAGDGQRDFVEEAGLRTRHTAYRNLRPRVRDGDGDEQAECDPDYGADQGVDQADLGGQLRGGDREDQHRADRRLQGLLTEAQHLGQDQRGGDDQAQTPPGETDGAG